MEFYLRIGLYLLISGGIVLVVSVGVELMLGAVYGAP